MLYILLAMAICFLIIQMYWLLEMKKHDQHLFELCQLQREGIAYLSNSYRKLSRTDYIAIRKTNNILSTIIDEYKAHRTVVFNFRLFAEYLDELKTVENRAEKISTSNKEIQNLLNRVRCALFKAFLAFTPFLKSEFAFFLLMNLISFGVKAGVNSLKGYLLSLKEAKMMVNTFKSFSSPG